MRDCYTFLDLTYLSKALNNLAKLVYLFLSLLLLNVLVKNAVQRYETKT